MTETEILNQIRTTSNRMECYAVELTPALATLFLSTAKHNRPLNPQRVKKYEGQIAQRQWAHTGEPLIFSRGGNMLNGSHRCHATILAGVAVPVTVILGIDEQTWKHMDSGRSRSTADNLPAGQTYRTETAAVLNLIQYELSGVLSQYGSGGKHALSASDAPDMLECFPGVDDAIKFMISARCRHFGNHSVLSYSYFRAHLHDPVKADEFFTRLGDGINLQLGSPMLALRERLNVIKKDTKRTTKTDEVLAIVIKAWTKFTQGQSVRDLRWRSVGSAAETFPLWPGPSIRTFARGRLPG